MTIKNGEFAVGETTYTAENVGQLWGYVAEAFNREAADTFRKNFETYLNGEGNNRNQRTDVMNLLSLSGEQRIGFSEAFSWDYSKGVREDYLTTRDLGAYAKENGYDGVIIENITDSGGQTKGNPKGTIVIAFEANQIKAVSNENPTKSMDIRYSIPASEGAVNEKTTEEVGGGLSFCISVDTNGKLFVDVTENIFEENNGESIARVIQKFIKDKFINLILVNGQKIQINKTTNDEFRRSNSANALLNDPSATYNDKLKAIANADEILKVAKNWIGEELKHSSNDDIVEFARGNVQYRVGENGYLADVIVGIRQNGAAVLYDLVNIYSKKITEAPVTMASDNRSQRRQESSASFSIPESPQNVKEKSSNQNKTKQKQLEIIKKTNPMWDDYHTGIRTVDDIRTWEEVLELNDEREGQFVWGDFSREDAEQALKNGTITVYSSYPIENGVFVSTSYIQAEEYAGGRGGKVYSKTIPITNVAWINGDEGQYAKVNDDISFSVPASEGEAVTSKSLFNMVQKAKTAFDHSVLFPLRDPTENA